MTSNELQPIIHSQRLGLRIPFFVKKDDNEGIDFYYLGDVTTLPSAAEPQKMNNKSGKELDVVQFLMDFTDPVPEYLYRYLTR